MMYISPTAGLTIKSGYILLNSMLSHEPYKSLKFRPKILLITESSISYKLVRRKRK